MEFFLALFSSSSIKAGNSREVAAQVASVVYQQNYAAGVSLSPACLAAEVAWKNAPGGDPRRVQEVLQAGGELHGVQDCEKVSVRLQADQSLVH